MWWEILIAGVVVLNWLIAYSCCVVGARADERMAELESEVGDGNNKEIL